MAKVLQIGTSQLSVNDSLTRYAMAGSLTTNAHLFTEADVKITARIPGVLSKLSFYTNTNDIIENASTVRTRKNGANGGQTITIAAGANGWFEDTSGTDTLADGDTFNYQIVTGANAGVVSLDVSGINTTFAATTNTVSYITSSSLLTTAASSTRYTMLSGAGDSATTNTTIYNRFNTAGTLKKLYFYTKANATTTASTVSTYNKTTSTAGNCTVTVTAGTTGIYEDTTNTDTVSDNDEWCYQIVTGATGALTLTSRSICFETTDSSTAVLGGRVGTVNLANFTYWMTINGAILSGNESVFKTKVREAYTISNLFVQIRTNTVTATSTYTLRKNAASTALTISVASSTTGTFEDTTNSVTVVDGDYVGIQVATGATGTSLTSDNHSLKMVGPVVAGNTGNFFLMF